MVDALTVVSIGLVTVIGAALLLFGFEIAKPLLGIGGAIAGGVLGGGAGFVLLPSLVDTLQFETRLFVGVAGVFVGLVVGYSLIPLVGRLAAAAAGFAGTALATIVVLTGEEVLDSILTVIPEDPLGNPGAAVQSLQTAPVFEQAALQETFAIAAGVGLVGAVVALRYYTDIVALVATTAGAALIGVVGPLWMALLEEGAVDPTLAEFSIVWFAGAFVLGVAFQLSRHFEALDPRSGDEYVN